MMIGGWREGKKEWREGKEREGERGKRKQVEE